MPGPYVTSNGLTIPTVESIISDLEADLHSLVDENLDTDPESPAGQFVGIFASHLREAWETIEVAYNAYDPAQAEDDRADKVAAVTGTRRQGATKSAFIGTRRLLVDLNASTTLPVGTIFEITGDPATRFLTTEEIVSTTAGSYQVSAEAENAGRVTAAPNTVTTITTPVVGLNSVNNPLSPVVGRAADSDPELMARRARELRALGGGTVPGVQARVAAIEVEGDRPILSVEVFENDTDYYDALGLPPHSIEVLLWDGLAAATDNDLIAQTIWAAKAGGTKTWGTSTGTAVDANGDEFEVRFSRPSQVGLKGEVTVFVDSTFPGTQAAYDAWSAFVNAWPTGEPMDWGMALNAILSIQGVRGVATGIRLGRVGGSYGTVNTDLAVGPREKLYADASITHLEITATVI